MKPILLELGPFSLSGYFLFGLLAFVVAALWAARRGLSSGLSPNQLTSLGIIALISFLVGSRIGNFFMEWNFYLAHPDQIFKFGQGGYMLLGGLLIATAAVSLTLTRMKLPVMATLGRMVPPMILAAAIARLGCFFEGCCFGDLTRMPWGMVFPPESVARHPTQLYESLFLLLLMAWMLRSEKRGTSPQEIILLAGSGYGFWRFGVGFLRADHMPFFLGLTVPQLLMLPIAVICWMALRRHRAGASSTS